MDKGGLDEDEVKMVSQWKARGISEIAFDQQPDGTKPRPANAKKGRNNNNASLFVCDIWISAA